MKIKIVKKNSKTQIIDDVKDVIMIDKSGLEWSMNQMMRKISTHSD